MDALLLLAVRAAGLLSGVPLTLSSLLYIEAISIVMLLLLGLWKLPPLLVTTTLMIVWPVVVLGIAASLVYVVRGIFLKTLEATSKNLLRRLERQRGLEAALTTIGIAVFIVGNVLQFWSTFLPK